METLALCKLKLEVIHEIYRPIHGLPTGKTMARKLARFTSSKVIPRG